MSSSIGRLLGWHMALVGSLGFAQVAHANEFARQWQEPLQIELPQPTRNVVLSSRINPQDWLADNRIFDAQLVPQGPRLVQVQFPMSDEEWAASQADMCAQSGVVACEQTACQTIQLTAQTTGAKNSEKVKARIVKNAPELDVFDERDGDAGSCRQAAALAGLDSLEAGQGINLSLDLRGLNQLEGNSRSGQTVGQPDAQSPKQAQVQAAETSANESIGLDQSASAAADADTNTQTDTNPEADQNFYDATGESLASKDFKLSVQSNFNGTAELMSESVPADTSDYSLLVGEQCNAVRIPLDSVVPAYVPNLVTAVVNGGSASAVAGRNGLVVVREVVLASTNDSMVVFASKFSLVQTLSALQIDADVLAAQREYIYNTTAGSAGFATTRSYSDPLATFNYGPEHTGALALHGATQGNGQLVAVIDTGVAADHPDLLGKVQTEDVIGKGWTADAHGTAVAGIIAASADNAVGAYGVAPEVKILALKACQATNAGGLQARCWTSTLVQALDIAMANNADIINMSLAGPPDELLAKYVALAVAQNRLVIAGAGNGGPSARPAFPAALPGVLAVTAIDNSNIQYADANRGDYIDLAAPGVDIVTVQPDGSFPVSSGTSWAAAHVSGIAALLKNLVPLTTSAEIAAIMQTYSTDIGVPGRDKRFGYGVVNACGAAAAATADAVHCEGLGDEGLEGGSNAFR